MNICFIGYGNMAKAIAKGLTQNQDITIHACAPSLKEGYQQDGIYTHSDNNSVIHDMDVVILAVKPQQVNHVLPSLQLKKDTVLVSIAAGITLKQLANLIPDGQPIVRTMPNTPLEVGCGATQLVANTLCSSAHKKMAESLFANNGIFIWLDNEAMIDAYTSLSGSGPAYIFYILEAMIDGAQKLGIDTANARIFAEQTMLGALTLSQQSKLPLEKLREQVTSPGGATAEAIKIFDLHKFKDIFANAMAASYNKAKQLKESIQ